MKKASLMNWMEFVQSETPQDVLETLPVKVISLTERVRKGKESIANETDAEAIEKYTKVLARLKRERDFLIAVFRFRDEEIPTMIGVTDKVAINKNDTGEIFRRILSFFAGDIYRDKENPERKKWIDAINEACRVQKDNPKYLSMLQDIDKYEGEYDYGDIPAFYHDLCITLNKIVDSYMVMSMYIFKNNLL